MKRIIFYSVLSHLKTEVVSEKHEASLEEAYFRLAVAEHCTPPTQHTEK